MSVLKGHAQLFSLYDGYLSPVISNSFRTIDVYKFDHRCEAINWARQKVRRLDEEVVPRYNESREAHFLQKIAGGPNQRGSQATGGFEDGSKNAMMTLTDGQLPELVEPLSRLVLLNYAYAGAVRAEAGSPGAHRGKGYREIPVCVRDEIGAPAAIAVNLS